MRVDPDSGLVDLARQAPSPNCDERPADTAIDMLVVHNISLPPGQFGGPYIERFFRNILDWSLDPFFQQIRDLKVSSHFLIRRDGELVQFVPIHRRAWHAGVSSWQGRERCNDFSIGVELEGTDVTPYTDAQYDRLAALSRCLMRYYPKIIPARIVGHSDIAPGRKTDPGPAFDWDRLKQAVEGATEEGE